MGVQQSKYNAVVENQFKAVNAKDRCVAEMDGYKKTIEQLENKLKNQTTLHNNIRTNQSKEQASALESLKNLKIYSVDFKIETEKNQNIIKITNNTNPNVCTKYKIADTTLEYSMSDIDSRSTVSTPQVSFTKDSFWGEEFYFVSGTTLTDRSVDVSGNDVLKHGQKCTWVMRNCVFVKIDVNGDFEVKDKAKPGEVKKVNFEENKLTSHGTQYNWIHTYVNKSLQRERERIVREERERIGREQRGERREEGDGEGERERGRNNPVPRYIMYTYAKTPVEMEDHRINVIDEKIYSAVSFVSVDKVILPGGGSANMDDPLRYLHPLPNA
jgi:hypothetical protein